MSVRDEIPGSSTTNRCPSWELISAFADAELAADDAAMVEQHLRRCRMCGALLQLLPAPLAAPVPRSDEGVADCPTMEALLDYLVSPAEAASDEAVDAHVRHCDRCVGRLAGLARTDQLDDPAVVPAAVVARAATAARPARQQSPKRPDAVRHTPVWLRLPVLLPLAFAAGVCVFVGTQQLQESFAGSGERWRAVRARPAPRRVLTADTPLRMSAHPDAGIVTEIQRGTSLDIIAEQSDWLQVALPDGRQGWAPRRAFE